MVELKTKRLILREVSLDDAEKISEYLNDLEVSKYLPQVSYPYKKKDALEFIRIYKREVKGKRYLFAITNKKGDFLGCIDLLKVSLQNGDATIGYWLGRNYWRKGYMTEVLNRIINFSFKELGLRRININAFRKNKASNKLIKKVGFKKEGLRRKYSVAISNGEIHDLVIYGLLKEEWKNDKDR